MAGWLTHSFDSQRPDLSATFPSFVAIDLGAESCRVSLLTAGTEKPHIRLVHRFPNAPITQGESLFWDLKRILSEIDCGLLRCAELAAAPVTSIGVDGWAVDYVRLNDGGQPIGLPFCYRDLRTEAMLKEVEARCPRERLFALSGAQPLRINTHFQLMAGQAGGMPATARWVNLPEYVLATLGGKIV